MNRAKITSIPKIIFFQLELPKAAEKPSYPRPKYSPAAKALQLTAR